MAQSTNIVNSFLNNYGGSSAFASASSLASQVTGGLGGKVIPASALAAGGTGTNVERLAQILPRSAQALEVGAGLTNVPADLTDRGTIASLTLIGDTNVKNYDLSGSEDDLSSAFSFLQTANPGFTDFFLTAIDFDYQEKMQISQTFGDNEVVYYFGKQPVFMNITGALFDSLAYSWFTQFISLYNGVLRGSKNAMHRSLVQFNLPNMTVIGTFNALNTTQQSINDTVINFSARVLVKSVRPIPVGASYSGFFNYTPSSSTTNILNWSVGREGLGGTTFSSLLSKGVGGVTSTGVLDAGLKAIQGISSPSLSHFNALSSFGKGVFSPIFTILSSVTNIVQTSTGSLESLVSNFTTPVKNVLGVVQSILGAASNIAQTVERDFAATVGMVTSTVNEVYSTLQIARNTVGIISQVPETMAQSLQVLSDTVTRGPNAYNLFLGGSANTSKLTYLSSGSKYNPVAPYAL